jgi:hypothetical protein
LEAAAAAARPFLAYRNANPQQQVWRFGHRPQDGQGRLHLAQRCPLMGTRPAILKVGGDALHLMSVQLAIQILGKS